ncbi:MAG: hypothetical protein H7249_20900 [Chitinophagaceae bacterium]|nr:hypothetical protein [Oligoflexus sp.]
MKLSLFRMGAISLTILALSCSSNHKVQTITIADKNAATGSGNGTGEVAIKTVKNIDATSGDVDGASLSLVVATGSSMRFLDARALGVLYANVFKKAAYGYQQCAGTTPREATDCTESIFMASERPDLGSFDLGTAAFARAPQNVNPTTSLTLNYTRTLRLALSRECRYLVTNELAIVNNKASTPAQIAANVLVKSQIVDAATLIDFEKRLLGIAGTSIPIDIDAASYVTAFKTVAAADKVNGVYNGYVDLCIALSMDPLVFIY